MTGVDSSDFLKVLFSFIPSAVLGVTGYLIKRKFLDRKNGCGSEQDKQSSEMHTDQTDLSLADLEAGLVATEEPLDDGDDGEKGVDEQKNSTNPQVAESEV